MLRFSHYWFGFCVGEWDLFLICGILVKKRLCFWVLNFREFKCLEDNTVLSFGELILGRMIWVFFVLLSLVLVIILQVYVRIANWCLQYGVPVDFRVIWYESEHVQIIWECMLNLRSVHLKEWKKQVREFPWQMWCESLHFVGRMYILICWFLCLLM